MQSLMQGDLAKGEKYQPSRLLVKKFLVVRLELEPSKMRAKE
jgi:hypothetical protein